jgi:amino acid adenylation domain-containing protein
MMSEPGRVAGQEPPDREALLAQRLGKKPGEVFPLSFAQQRLWFLEQLEPGRPIYNVPLAIRLRGPLDRPALERSLDEVRRRHESLRTIFPALGGRPVQVISPPEPLAMPVSDLTGLPAADREKRALRLANEEARRPFDLERGPVMRVFLFALGETDHLLLLNLHHIVADAWSMGVLMRELGALYAAFRAGRAADLPDLPIQYVDYAHWQRQWLQGEVLAKQLAYWKAQLGGELWPLDLPTDRPRPAVATYQGATLSRDLRGDLAAGLGRLSQEEGTTSFMTLLAAFQALLCRYTGKEDIVVGVPAINRAQGETQGLIGFFTNTLALRADLGGDPTFRELLRRVRATTLAAYEHQDLPFERLVEVLQPGRDLSHTPLFQVMLAPQTPPAQGLALPGLTITDMDLHNGASKFDLTLFLREGAGRLKATFEYATDLYDAATIARMLGHFETLLCGIAADPDQRLSHLPILSGAERRRVVVEWNDTAAPYPDQERVHDLFCAQVRRTPDAVAVTFDGRQLTYGELDSRANQLAHYLQGLGVGPDAVVGICLERSLEMAVAVLGVLKAGGAYLPLDPAYPAERLAFMLADARSPVLLTHKRLPPARGERSPAAAASAVPAASTAPRARVIRLDADWEAIAGASDAEPECAATPDSLAYVIYTSGSTGTPKGVAMPHRPLVNLIAWQLGRSACGPGTKTLQLTSLSFDVAFQELFATWCGGGTLVMIGEAARQDLVGLPRLLAERGVERLFLPFVALHNLAEVCRAEGQFPVDLREVITAGERLEVTPAIVRLFTRLPAATLDNQYGPSESHVVTAFKLEGPPEKWPALPPIGRPIANTAMYILDRHLNAVPVGVPGELFIGGVALARGYLDRPELTAERFSASPSGGDQPGGAAGRLYRTGDLGRFLPDGNIEFLGRADNQVKVRGFRVEPGEVEATLQRCPRVREAVVVGQRYGTGDKRLVAYLVLGGGEEPAPAVEDLRAFVRERLPEYMVPSAFVLLEKLPLTPSGKVDRRALPAPEGGGLGLAVAYEPPRTKREETLAKVWARVLGREKIGVNDNFFALGGHSLLATQVMSGVRQAFQVELPLRVLFERPTIAGLAAAVEDALLATVDAEELEHVLDELEGASDGR